MCLSSMRLYSRISRRPNILNFAAIGKFAQLLTLGPQNYSKCVPTQQSPVLADRHWYLAFTTLKALSPSTDVLRYIWLSPSQAGPDIWLLKRTFTGWWFPLYVLVYISWFIWSHNEERKKREYILRKWDAERSKDKRNTPLNVLQNWKYH